MKQLYSKMTSKGQVTIPAEIRRLLGLSPREKVVFILGAKKEVRLAPGGSVVARTAGSLKTGLPPDTAIHLREAAEAAIAEDAAERGGR